MEEGYAEHESGEDAGNEKTGALQQAPERLGEKIRTSGLLNPIQARYQTAPHPDIAFQRTERL